MNAPRAGGPINLTLEALGDRWSLARPEAFEPPTT